LLRPRRCRVFHTYHGHVLHSYFGPLKTALFVSIERWLALCTDRIVVISEQQRRELSQHYSIGRPEQYQVIPLGLDLKEGQVPEGQVTDGCGGVLRRELGLTETDLLVGIVGRLSPVKNHDMLLEAAAMLCKEAPELADHLHFVIIGDGELRADLEARAMELGLSQKITFSGFRRDAVSLFRDLDLVALTSLNEGTPLTLIEAMHAGRAVVATQVGGVVDLIGSRLPTDGSGTGFALWDHGATTPSRDTIAFANALRHLLERPDLRREMGLRGQQFVQTHYSVDRMIRDVKALYTSVIGAR